MSQKRANRRLAAILAADVIGYSRMMGADEYGTLKAVKRLRTSTMERLLTRFEGRLIKTTGDGFLFEFGSVFDAFDFAAAIQGRAQDEDALQLRMGLNVGDIIFDDGDVFGDGVNVAARLEPLSPPGGLLVSNRAWEDLRRLPLAFEDAGEIELKNIKEPLRAWRLQNEQLCEYSHALEADRDVPAPRGEDIRSRAAPLHLRSRRAVLAGGAVATVALASVGGWVLLRPDAAKANSIAVLPFANLSGDATQVYFSDGIAEELRSALARLAGLKVVGRTSSEAVREDDAETAAKKLGVSNILTGSVRQSPSTIRISAQLIDGENGLERWSQHYDRAPGDSIKIQTDIAENVARSLSIALGPTAQRAITVGGTSNPEAQRLLLQAVEATRRGDKEALQRGISLADAAIRVDSEYAEAYATKALFQNWYASTYSSDVGELFRMRGEAKATAQRALDLAPMLASGHRALGEIHRVLLEIRPAVTQYKRAIELAPGDSGAVSDYSFMLGSLGNISEATRLADQAIALDPLNSTSYLSRFMALLAARRLDEAVRFAQQLERTKPHLFEWPEALAYALVAQNRFAEAETYLSRAPADNYNRLVNEAVILSRTGKGEQVPGIIARMRQLYADATSYQYGQVYAQLGDTDRAFAALNRAWEIRDAGLLRLKTDPFIDPIRSDPRFAQLVQKLNFPA